VKILGLRKDGWAHVSGWHKQVPDSSRGGFILLSQEQKVCNPIYFSALKPIICMKFHKFKDTLLVNKINDPKVNFAVDLPSGCASITHG
jgi:hypothetical protein